MSTPLHIWEYKNKGAPRMPFISAWRTPQQLKNITWWLQRQDGQRGYIRSNCRKIQHSAFVTKYPQMSWGWSTSSGLETRLAVVQSYSTRKFIKLFGCLAIKKLKMIDHGVIDGSHVSKWCIQWIKVPGAEDEKHKIEQTFNMK